LLLALVLGLGGLAYNYKRNLDLEAQEARPYQGYADADLAALIEAYGQQVKQLQARPVRRTQGARSRGETLGERIRSYQRVHAAGAARRLQAGELAGQEAILRKLEREREIRDTRGTGWQLYVHRALRF